MNKRTWFIAGALAAGLVAGCGGNKSSSSNQGPFASAATTAGAHSASTTTTTTTTSTQPGTPPSTPTPSGPKFIVSGWLPYWTYTNGDAIIDANTGNGLDEVNLFGIGLQPDGSLTKRTGIEDPARIAMIRARGGEVIPTVYDVHDRSALASVLGNATYRARAIREMVDLIVQGNYDGLDIDFENSRTATRDAFSSFVADLGAAVRATGKVFSLTIPGKWRDLPSWAGYDYKALGPHADRIKLMCYGYSGSWTAYPGGPIAPTDWIKKVLDYATTEFPANKIQVGVPFYGTEWDTNGGARSRTYRAAMDLLQRPSATPLVFEPTRGEAHFEYVDGGVTRTVWFSEERSIRAKAALVKQYNCLGLSIWALGYGNKPMWDAVRAELKP